MSVFQKRSGIRTVPFYVILIEHTGHRLLKAFPACFQAPITLFLSEKSEPPFRTCRSNPIGYLWTAGRQTSIRYPRSTKLTVQYRCVCIMLRGCFGIRFGRLYLSAEVLSRLIFSSKIAFRTVEIRVFHFRKHNFGTQCSKAGFLLIGFIAGRQ